MSDTHHHRTQKTAHCGQDLWAKRPCAGLCYTTYNKWLTRKRERCQKQSHINAEYKAG